MTDSFEDAQPFPPPDLKRTRRRGIPSTNGHIDRLPPFSLESEQGVLGCCLVSPRDCLPEVIARLSASDEAFYDLRHQTIFANLMQMSNNDISGIDVITFQQRLKDFGLLEDIGGIEYLNTLQDCITSTANLSYYLDIVLDKFMLRKALSVCTDSVCKIYESEAEASQIVDEIERDALTIRQNAVSTESFGMKQLIPDTIARIDMMAQGRSVSGIATGFADLDVMTGGLQKGEMIVIAARPSLGKTSLALNIAEYVAVENKIPVGVFSLEMTKEALTDRLVSSRARVNLRKIREGFMSERDYTSITTAAGQINSCPLRIDDTTGLSVMALRARARSMWQQFGIKLLVVDYLQLLNSKSRRAQDNRQQEVADISSGVKGLAKELGVPVIILSQLNREFERDKNRKPRLSDLRESGAIEQDADVVGLLYKPKFDDEGAAEESDVIPTNLLIAKQRNGPTGDIWLTFFKSWTRFESASKVSDDDVPQDTTDYQPPLPDA